MTAEIWSVRGDAQKALDIATMALGLVLEGETPTTIYRLIASFRRKLKRDGQRTAGTATKNR
jgi:hypothetical protein